MKLSHDFIEEFLESKGVRAILKKAKLPTKWEFELDEDDYEATSTLQLYPKGGKGEYFHISFAPLPGCCGGTVIHSPEFAFDSTPDQRKAFFDLALKIVAAQAWNKNGAGSTIICTTIADQTHFIEALEAHRFRRVGEHENANTSRIVTTWWKGVNAIPDYDKFIETYDEPEKSSDDDEDDSDNLSDAIKCNCPSCRTDKALAEKPKKVRKLRL